MSARNTGRVSVLPFSAVALVVALVSLLTLTGRAQSARTLLTPSDLQWAGMYAFPSVGSATSGGPGTTAYASGALAVRYVGGERRFLMPTFMNQDMTTGQTFGDLVEWRVPSASPYTGSDPNQAPAMVEVRRWKNWTMLSTTPTWQERTGGVRIGGLYWDEAQGVLWYQLYAYYSGTNHPFLAATRLLDSADTASGGDYVQTGTQYGPWWYRNNNPSDTTNLYWKAVFNWIVPVPSDAQTDLQGNTMIIGAGVGAVGGAGNLGPGFRAIPALPSLNDAPNSIVPLGLRLADYTNESPVAPSNALRDANYSFDGVPHTSSESGLFPPANGVGYWQMSLDQVNSFVWIETPTREGILLFGREATGLHWYGFNPRSATPGWVAGPPDATDPTRQIPDSNGYGSTGWQAALYEFDPAQVRQVGRGTRQPWSNGINPVAAYDWHSRWPNIPLDQYRPGPTATQGRIIESTVSNTAFWDSTKLDLIWIQPDSTDPVSPRPTLQLFSFRPTAPTNVHISGQ